MPVFGRFTGQRWDSGTALYFYQSRWYDPAVGRFLQADTIVAHPGNPAALSRYGADDAKLWNLVGDRSKLCHSYYLLLYSYPW